MFSKLSSYGISCRPVPCIDWEYHMKIPPVQLGNQAELSEFSLRVSRWTLDRFVSEIRKLWKQPRFPLLSFNPMKYHDQVFSYLNPKYTVLYTCFILKTIPERAILSQRQQSRGNICHKAIISNEGLLHYRTLQNDFVSQLNQARYMFYAQSCYKGMLCFVLIITVRVVAQSKYTAS